MLYSTSTVVVYTKFYYEQSSTVIVSIIQYVLQAPCLPLHYSHLSAFSQVYFFNVVISSTDFYVPPTTALPANLTAATIAAVTQAVTS